MTKRKNVYIVARVDENSTISYDRGYLYTLYPVTLDDALALVRSEQDWPVDTLILVKATQIPGIMEHAPEGRIRPVLINQGPYTEDVCTLGWNKTTYWLANARRIARVPEMEARILADAEALKAADALAKWAGIAVSRKPNQRTGGRMVLEADLLRIEEALAAYQETREPDHE